MGFLMISNNRMYKNLMTRWAREDEMTEERLNDCRRRIQTEGKRAKYTGQEKFQPLAFLKKPRYWILDDKWENYDEETGELISATHHLVRIRKPKRD